MMTFSILNPTISRWWPVAGALLLYSCAPQLVPPARVLATPNLPAPHPPAIVSATPEGGAKRPLLEQAEITEEKLPQSTPPSSAKGKGHSPNIPREREVAPALSPRVDGSLIAKITSKTPPQRAASLRLTEDGRKLLEAAEYRKALARFEKSITIDSTNPYGYFYLAQAHYFLAHYQESLNFLDVAESLFTGQPYWLAEVFALRGENFRALGVVTRANSNYAEALRLNPGHLIAAEWMGRAETAVLPPQR